MSVGQGAGPAYHHDIFSTAPGRDSAADQQEQQEPTQPPMHNGYNGGMSNGFRQLPLPANDKVNGKRRALDEEHAAAHSHHATSMDVDEDEDDAPLARDSRQGHLLNGFGSHANHLPQQNGQHGAQLAPPADVPGYR